MSVHVAVAVLLAACRAAAGVVSVVQRRRLPARAALQPAQRIGVLAASAVAELRAASGAFGCAHSAVLAAPGALPASSHGFAPSRARFARSGECRQASCA